MRYSIIPGRLLKYYISNYFRQYISVIQGMLSRPWRAPLASTSGSIHSQCRTFSSLRQHKKCMAETSCQNFVPPIPGSASLHRSQLWHHHGERHRFGREDAEPHRLHRLPDNCPGQLDRMEPHSYPLFPILSLRQGRGTTTAGRRGRGSAGWQESLDREAVWA